MLSRLWHVELFSLISSLLVSTSPPGLVVGGGWWCFRPHRFIFISDLGRAQIIKAAILDEDDEIGMRRRATKGIEETIGTCVE